MIVIAPDQVSPTLTGAEGRAGAVGTPGTAGTAGTEPAGGTGTGRPGPPPPGTGTGAANPDPAALEKLQIDESDLPKYRFIQETHADFEAYFSRFHRHPFIGMIDLSAPYLDAVIHYETLQADFADLLVGLGIRQVRPVPLVNKTAGRGADDAPRCCRPLLGNREGGTRPVAAP